MDAATIAALLAALGVGGVAGVLLRAEHERTERMRERMIVAADEFLDHAGEARRLVDRARVQIRGGDRPSAEASLHEAAVSIAKARTATPRLAILYGDENVPGTAREITDQLVEMVVHTDEIRINVADGDDMASRKELLDEARRQVDYQQTEMAGFVRTAVRRRWQL